MISRLDPGFSTVYRGILSTPFLGDARMFGFGAGEARNAIERGLEQLSSILARLDALESAPRLPLHSELIDPRLDALETGFDRITSDFKATNFAVAEGIERTDRSERRIHATIKRARAELKKRGYEDPGLEAEAYELHAIDGGGGADGGVPEVPEDVASAPSEASSIPGVPASTLARIRSFN